MRRHIFIVLAALFMLLFSMPADALRCGHKLVNDGMHASEVRDACGEPASVRHLGYVIRYYGPVGGRHGGIYSGRHQGDLWRREVPVTEFVYNFGPKRLMRKLRFEDGLLTSIRTLGYGYRE